MTHAEAARVRACCDCGAHGATLVRTTTGENPGRALRICSDCWRSGRWDEFGLVDRDPFLFEVPTEYVEGEWRWPTDGSEPAAVVTYAAEPSPETGDVGWCWWALGRMGEADSYEAACDAAVAEVQRRMDERVAVL